MIGQMIGNRVAGRRVRIGAAILIAATSACAGEHKSNESNDANGSLVSAGTPKSNGAPSPSARPTSGTLATARRTVLFVGTSLTAGLGLEPDSAYPMLIQRKIDSAGLPFDVTNAGVSGETSSGLLDRLDWLLRGKFDVMVLETGANDGLRGLPPATLRANLERALDRIKAARPDVRILVVQMEALPNLGAKYAAEFHAVYPTVAKEKGVTLMPFLLGGVAGDRALNQADGVHPNYRGERIVAANVWAGLEPVLTSLTQAQAP
jgi:acyl-CoA thioesterase-1